MTQRQIDVNIHGVLVSGVDTLFYPNQRVLIGRPVLFQLAQAVGFEHAHWLLKHKPAAQTAAAPPALAAAVQPAGPAPTIEDRGSYLIVGGVRIDVNRRA
jgi:hypothetical protein